MKIRVLIILLIFHRSKSHSKKSKISTPRQWHVHLHRILQKSSTPQEKREGKYLIVDKNYPWFWYTTVSCTVHTFNTRYTGSTVDLLKNTVCL